MKEIFRQKTSEKVVDESLVNECGLSLDFLKILNLRGINTKEKIENFLEPSISNMSSPFDIDNMSIAIERIKNAISANERILVYGDYDCDGICAISILMLYFRSQNANATYFIPNRNSDGYGMSRDTLIPILQADKPDLLITVDCGVTAVAEVAFLKENGVDVIVTDHHEPQEALPDCVIVNPKVSRKGFYEFCGAGVALKLVEALSSRDEIKKYLDIAAIATIADIVPLTDENRIIAYHGIKQLNKKMRKGVEMLLGAKTCNSYEIMYKLAPRINAAGRMDSAMKAVGLFLSDDYFVLDGLTQDLNKDNILRQQTCEEVVKKAKEKLSSVDFSECSIITLYDESWEAGVLGIAASRLVEDFNRPAILFALKDGLMKGSARSINEVNIFETLSKFSSLFIGFGGHAQAAGLSIKKYKFEEFKNGINEFLNKSREKSIFEKTVSYDIEIDLKSELILFAKELERLEPTGFGNSKPSFKLVSNALNFERIGVTNHIKCAMHGLEIIGFGKYEQILSAKCNSEFEVLLSRNIFQNNEYAQIIMRGIYVKEVENLSDEDLILSSIHQLSHERVNRNGDLGNSNNSATNNQVSNNHTDGYNPCYNAVNNNSVNNKTNNNTYSDNINGEFENRVCNNIEHKSDVSSNDDNSRVCENAEINNAEQCGNNFCNEKIDEFGNKEQRERMTEIDIFKLKNYLEKPIGTLLVCYTLEGLERLKSIAKELPVAVGLFPNANPENKIILCPSQNFDFRFFNKVVLIETSSCKGYNDFIALNGNVEVLKNSPVVSFTPVEDELLRQVFVELREMSEKRMRAQNLDKMIKAMKQKMKITQYELALSLQIFSELHLISTNERGIIEVSNNKTELIKSVTYRNMKN
ncbi:MAG: single-stranded-DNA-specific exonuclease RecJ [Clostridia bacterium]|nr:single-stranded-DNA-specific exonuclease RecJ [Clostridia bacterium]